MSSNFPDRLKALRQERCLSQEQLGTELKIPRTTISSWELASRQADTLSINVLCDFFHVSSDYLLGRTDVRNPVETYAINNELLDLFNRVPDIKDFINKVIVKEDLQFVIMQIKDLSEESLIKLAKIARVLQE